MALRAPFAASQAQHAAVVRIHVEAVQPHGTEPSPNVRPVASTLASLWAELGCGATPLACAAPEISSAFAREVCEHPPVPCRRAPVALQRLR